MRDIRNINDSWKFIKEGKEETVSLPYTWNAVDGQDGGNDYYRGTCRFEKLLSEKEIGNLSENEKIYLEINGAAMTAEVFLNGEKLCHHEGGYSTFRVDLTGHLKRDDAGKPAGGDLLVVTADNSDNDTVYPQKADFTFYGGLYRDVNLVIVPKTHFTLDYYGTPGIKVTPVVDLEKKSAVVSVEAYVTGDEEAEVAFRIGDEEKTVPVKEGRAEAAFTINEVHLWDGLEDPYLYTAEAVLSTGDQLKTRFGCRVFGTDPEKGFLLNGRVYPLRGVSRHQDVKGKGNALLLEDHQADMKIIKELGANTLRLAHYQHAQEFYDLCDENGIVVWAEIPYITMHMHNGTENALSQMKELIIQNYNHPSIAVWGLSNEITAASAVNEELLSVHRQLNELCHRLDPTRQTTMANVFMLETDSPILEIPDINSYNLYFGWYLGELSQTDEFFDEYHEKYPDRVIGFSEYGADANPSFQSSHPEKGDYTETYQAVYHEHMLRMIEERPYLWATHVWNLFDFAADGRDEGGKNGENQKGLVTFDRQIKKDAFYLYKAAWNKKEPFVHLCGSRYVDRAESETEIKVYSNQSAVTLSVDGKEVETKEGKIVLVFRIPISGKHEIKAYAAGNQAVSDTIRIQRVEKPNEAYIFNKSSQVVNWFDREEINPDYYSIQDTLAELRANEEAGAIVNEMMEKGAADRGDVADAVKDNPALQRMMGRMTLLSLLKQGGADEESILQLNRTLQGIRK